MHIETALRAVQGERLEFSFEIAPHLEELQAQHLGVDDERIGATVADLDRLVDEGVGVGGLLGDGVDGALEDVALKLRRAGAIVTLQSNTG